MKRVQKVLLITAVPILLTIAFYGYHVYRAISLDEENSRTYSATALSFLTSSEEWDKVIQCNPWPKSLSQQRFDPKEYLEIGSIADVYYGRHDKFGKQKIISSIFSIKGNNNSNLLFIHLIKIY